MDDFEKFFTRNPPDLSQAEQIWIEEYIATGSEEMAAFKAGDIFQETPPSARFHYELKRRKEYYKLESDKRQRMIFNEIARLAFFDPARLYDKRTGKMRDILSIDDDTRAAIAGLDVEADEETGRTKTRIKLADKLKALQLLAQNEELLRETLTVKLELSDKEAARRIAFAMANGLHASGDNAENPSNSKE